MRITVILGLALVPAALAAQTESALRGTITDATTRAPIPAARVDLVPGGRGAVTDSEGRYLVRELRPGTYRVTVRAIGYAPLARAGVRIGGNQTIVFDFALRPEAVEVDEIVVEARPDPILDPRVAATTQSITADELRELPVTTLAEAIELQGGVVSGSFRGGRLGEDALIVDGLGLKSQLDASTGGLGLSLPTAALQEAAVVTNGFSARYGQALSGMVNVVTRDGGERLEASLAYETDRPLPNGADVGLDRVEATVGGPLFGGARFLAVLDARARIDDDPVNAPAPADPLDPRSARPWVLPHNSGEQFDLFAKLTLPLGSRQTLRVLGVGSERRRLLFDPVLKYAPDRGPGESVSGRLVLAHLRRASQPDSVNATIIDWRLGYFSKEAMRAPLREAPDHLFGAFSFGGFSFAGAGIARGRDTVAAARPIPGFAVPEFTSSSPWGVLAFFRTDSPRGELAWNRFREARARMDVFVGRGPFTDLRFGAEYVRQWVDTFSRLQSYRAVGDGAPPPTSTSFSPTSAAGYAELTHRMSDLTLSLGLRADAYDARAPRAAGETGGTKFALGPRLAVSTSLSAATVIASVGRFAQAPDFQYLVDAAFDDTLRTGRFRRGNPGLGFETSVQYELQVRLRASDVSAVRIGAFVKRLDGLIASVPVGVDPDSAMFQNGDFATVRGVEVRLEREFRDDLGARLSYTLQSAEATASDAFDFFRRLRISPVGDTIVPAVVSYPLDFDRRHTVIGVARARVPDAWGAALRGTEASLVCRWGSGLPYTRTNRTGDSVIGLPNSQRLPSQFSVDLRLGRRVRWGGLDLLVYLDVRNLTNRRNVKAVRRDTGSPEPGELQVRQMAEAAFAARPDPIPYEAPAYRPAADLNADGLIAGRAELLPLFERAARDFLQPLFAFGAPRVWRLGVRVGF